MSFGFFTKAMYISILEICPFLFYYCCRRSEIIFILYFTTKPFLFYTSQLSHDYMGKISDTPFKRSTFHPSKVLTMDCTL